MFVRLSLYLSEDIYLWKLSFFCSLSSVFSEKSDFDAKIRDYHS